MKVALRVSIALMACLLAATGVVQAQTFPTKPIHMVVAFAPGGAVDSVARKLAFALSEPLGQQIVIENRSGASGAIGSDYVAKAPADGYTLLFAPSTLLANPLVMKAKQPFDLHQDLAPIGMVASGPLLMLVPENGPATVSDFVKLAKAKPAQFNFGTGGYGSAPHLAEAYFKLRAGINDVPILLYRGTAPALTDLIAGRLSAMMEPTLSAIPQVRGGKVRALAITGSKRDPLFPEVPTFEEAGFPDMQFSTWYGVWAPAALPEPIKQKLIDVQKAVLRSPEFVSWLQQQGYEASPLSGAAFAAFLNNEERRYERIVREGNIQPQ
jgi:tripartite-type tricarboxylate transporter receptor subunit TctC